MSKKTLLAFIHIEKTAGTALNQYLTRSVFGFHPCLAFAFSDKVEKDQNYMRAEELASIRRFYPLLKGVGGHCLRSNADYGDKNCSVHYFTFLRDPVKRVISQFHHHREVMGVDWTFEDFLSNGDYNNLMCRRICGEASSEAAIAELKQRYFFVGLIEKLDESMHHFRTLANKLGYSFRNVEISSKNARVNRDNNPIVISDDIVTRIKELNAEDIKLYEYVQNSGPVIDGPDKWGETTIADDPVGQYTITDYVTGFINRVISVGYCRRVEFYVRNRNKAKLVE